LPPGWRAGKPIFFNYFFFGGSSRFSEFSTGMADTLGSEQLPVFAAAQIPQPAPGKMQNFVGENEPQKRCVRQKILLENDPALRDEGGGVHRTAAVGMRRQKLSPVRGQLRKELQMKRATLKFG